MIYKIRDSRLELLRILSAFLILCHHAIQHSGNVRNGLIQAPFTLTQAWSTVIGSWGQVGVLCFVIISSWFLVEPQGRKHNISSAFKLAGTSWLYSNAILLILLIAGFNVGIESIVQSLLIPLWSGYWFVIVFFAFSLLIPILQNCVWNLNDKQLRYAVIVGCFLVPCYNLYAKNFVGSYLTDLCYTFFLTAYLRKHDDNFIKRHALIINISLTIFVIILIIAGAYIGGKFNNQTVLDGLKVLHDRRNIFTIFQAISLFYCFQNLKPFHSNYVNNIAKTSFGTYLITENFLIRGGDAGISCFWNDLWHMDKFINMGILYFIPYSILAITLTFIVAVVIDYCRILIAKRINFKPRFLMRLDNLTTAAFYSEGQK